MRNKFIPAVIGIVVIAATGGLAYWENSQVSSAPLIVENQNDSAQPLYTFADIASHNTAADCWAIINSGVYNLTSWVLRHPGGVRAIENICGTDGSNAFNNQHTDGETQQEILAELKIGVVQE